MYSTIRTYLITFFTTVNAGNGTLEDFSENDSFLDNDKLPANQSDKRYQIKIEDIDDLDYDSPAWEIRATIELWFLIGNNTGNYATAIDSYIRPLLKQLKTSSGYEGTSFAVNSVENIKVSGLNKFIDGMYLNPSISLTLKCIDAS
jgi:hypothetical protein